MTKSVQKGASLKLPKKMLNEDTNASFVDSGDDQNMSAIIENLNSGCQSDVGRDLGNEDVNIDHEHMSNLVIQKKSKNPPTIPK